MTIKRSDYLLNTTTDHNQTLESFRRISRVLHTLSDCTVFDMLVGGLAADVGAGTSMGEKAMGRLKPFVCISERARERSVLSS